jgi:hypothetical protein
MNKEITIEDLKQIWLRWDRYNKPWGVENKSWNLTKKLSQKISDLLFLVSRTDKKTASKLGERVGTIVSQSFLLCYYIGYELASGGIARDDGTAYLKVATDPIDDFVLRLIGMLVGSGIIGKEEGRKRAIEIAELTGKAANDVCVLGINSFSSIKNS